MMKVKCVQLGLLTDLVKERRVQDSYILVILRAKGNKLIAT